MWLTGTRREQKKITFLLSLFKKQNKTLVLLLGESVVIAAEYVTEKLKMFQSWQIGLCLPFLSAVDLLE